MDQINDNMTPAPLDRDLILAFMSTVLLSARIIAVRGQPIPKAELLSCVQDAEVLLAEVERRGG